MRPEAMIYLRLKLRTSASHFRRFHSTNHFLNTLCQVQSWALARPKEVNHSFLKERAHNFTNTFIIFLIVSAEHESWVILYIKDVS